MASVPKYLPLLDDETYYPETDGEPMGETDHHIAVMLELRLVLQHYFAQQKIYVATNLFMYYEKGNPRAVKAPDVMIVKGVDNHSRDTFKTWVEMAYPCVVFEVTSASTIEEDRGPKRALYARLGVSEYFLFDPKAKVLAPPLQGYRLKGKRYVRLRPARDGSLMSMELGLRLTTDSHRLRLRDAQTGALLLTPDENAEQERQRAEQERQRAEQAEQRAEQAEQRAEQAEQRAEVSEAEAARLREELERLRRTR